MSFHVPEEKRVTVGIFQTHEGEGNNGKFDLKVCRVRVTVIASDGLGWEHVSVSRRDTGIPTWEMMCAIKDIFWDEEDCVIQYHPSKSQYVNFHPGCLHLWKPTLETFPTPPPILVGPQSKNKR